jgi:hypothetical protein
MKTYKVISELTIRSGSKEQRDFSFTDEELANRFYRDTLGNMAEDIADFGGEFVSTMIQVDENGLESYAKRHTISTTLNPI